MDWGSSRLDLWRSFCERYRAGEESVPLFECDQSCFVLTKEIGTTLRRKILRRGSAMEDEEIGNYREGVLAPLIASPIFNALLIPVGGAGGVSRAAWIVSLLR
jgi:hypothetical protein